MKRHLLNATAVVSLMVVTLLCLGFVSRIGVTLLNNPAGANSCWAIAVSASGGRVACYIETVKPPPKTVPIGLHFTPQGKFFPLQPPDLRRVFWEFDAHTLPAPPASFPGLNLFLLAFPIWCACAPFLIAPAIWFAKWRRKRRQENEAVEGFTVLQSTSTL